MTADLFAAALALQQAGRTGEAEDLYRRVLRQTPDDVRALTMLGLVADQNGRRDEALALLRRAADLGPGEFQPHANLALALRGAGRREEAAACLRRALDTPLPAGAQALLRFIGLLREEGLLEEAETAARRAIARLPQEARLHKALTHILEARGRLEEAAEALRAAIALDPSHGEGVTGLRRKLSPDHRYPDLIERLAEAELAAWERAPPAAPPEAPAVAPVALPPSERPLWSVMIPTRRPKVREFLLKAVGSAVAQGWPAAAMQIAVVDNSGEDVGIAGLIAGIFGDRVEYHRNPDSLPIWGSWNRCLALARGHLVHLLHDDDYVCDGFHRALTEPLRDGGALAAFCNHFILDEAAGVVGQVGREAETAGFLADFPAGIGKACCLQTPSIAVARRTYEALGGFASLRYYLDWEMWTRIAQAGPVWYTPAILAVYRAHRLNVTATEGMAGNPVALAERLTVLDAVRARCSGHPRGAEIRRAGLRLAVEGAVIAAAAALLGGRREEAAARLMAGLPRSLPPHGLDPILDAVASRAVRAAPA